MEVNYSLPVPLPQQSPMSFDLSILLVDSDVQNLQNLKLMLQLCGYNNVGHVRTAEDALWMLRRTPIDILMCEAFLPNVDGFQLLSAVRENFKSVQVFLFSDHVMGQQGLRNEIVIRALELGACDFYRKPISMEFLRDMCQHVFVKKIQSCNEFAPNLPPQSPMLANLGAKGCISEEKSVTKQKRKRDDDEEIMSGDLSSVRAFIKREIMEPKKQRLRWTEDLEKKFAAAVDAIRCTDQKVTASRIQGLMKDMWEEDLTISQISSHLQQYRKKTLMIQKKNTESCSSAVEDNDNEEQAQMLMKMNSTSASVDSICPDPHQDNPTQQQQQQKHDEAATGDSTAAWSEADIEELITSDISDLEELLRSC